MSSTNNSRLLKPWQFSLRSILIMTVTIGIVLGLVSQGTRAYRITGAFGKLPQDDEALRDWLFKQPRVVQVEIERDAELKIFVRQESSLFPESMIPMPLFSDLGFEEMSSVRWSVESHSLWGDILSGCIHFLLRFWWIAAPAAGLTVWLLTRRKKRLASS